MITINKYRVNALIPLATQLIKESTFRDKNGNDLPKTDKPKVINGYISSFNANCVMMTPLATSIMYENSTGSSEDKSIILKWILDILKRENSELTNETKLVNYIEKNSINGKLNTKIFVDILTAGNAFKLAFRKFKHV